MRPHASELSDDERTVRWGLIIAYVLAGTTGAHSKTPVDEWRPCALGLLTPASTSDRLVIDLWPFGPLQSEREYALDVRDGYVELDLRELVAVGTFRKPAPTVELVRGELRVGGDGRWVALFVTFVGPRGEVGSPRRTYVVGIGHKSLPPPVANERCLGSLADACVEVVGIERSGSITAPARVCGHLSGPPGGTLVIDSTSMLPEETVAALPQLPKPSSQRPTSKPQQVLPEPQPVSPWWAVLPVLAAAAFWVFVRRKHALVRYAESEICAVDRSMTMRATQRLRVILAGGGAGALACAGIALATFDFTNPILGSVMLMLATWAFASLHAAWRAHRAIALLDNPDVEVTSDRRAYVFVSHGTTLLRYIAMPRGMLKPLLRDMPVARVVSGS